MASPDGGSRKRPLETVAGAGAASPLLRFGAIADVQYADVDDAWNFKQTQRRRYRGALDCLRNAVGAWSAQDPPLDFVLDLGDIIDQLCESSGDSRRALDLVLAEFARVPVTVYHVVGNHELYNFSRGECAALIPNITPWYRSVRIAAGWRMVVLDAYDINAIERGVSETIEEGIAYLSRHNPNDLRAPRGSVDVSMGLDGAQRRFLPMGGAFRREQLRWLEAELREMRAAGERAIVLTHVPVMPEATVYGALVWNFDEALEALRSPSCGTVALVLAGHFHDGGYAFDAAAGTHHVTLPSPLHSSPEDPRAHCVVEVFEDRLEILGAGLVPSRSLALAPCPPSAKCDVLPAPSPRAGMAARL